MGTQIFSYICRLRPFLGVQNFEFQYFGGFQKNEYFWAMMKLWIFLFGSSQNLTILEGHLYIPNKKEETHYYDLPI